MVTSSSTPQAEVAPPPVMEFKLGSVKASIWRNEGEDDQVFYNVTVGRTYLDLKGDREFHTSSSFGAKHLPLLAEVSRKAMVFIYERQDEDRRMRRKEKATGGR